MTDPQQHDHVAELRGTTYTDPEGQLVLALTAIMTDGKQFPVAVDKNGTLHLVDYVQPDVRKGAA